jgi:hypothetical protein
VPVADVVLVELGAEVTVVVDPAKVVDVDPAGAVVGVVLPLELCNENGGENTLGAVKSFWFWPTYSTHGLD